MKEERWPRPCEIHSSQYFAEAHCYGVGIDDEKGGRPYALIGHNDGGLAVVWLDEHYTVKLK